MEVVMVIILWNWNPFLFAGDSRKGGKYTLGQIEVEDFRDSDERSEVSEPEVGMSNYFNDDWRLK